MSPTKGLAKPQADTIVTANNTAELIARINEANASGDNYIINLIATTYELTTVDNSADGNNGLPSILNNGSLTLNGNGAIISRNSGSLFRLFHIADGASVTLKNLALENGLAQGSDGTGGGGGGAGFGGAIFNRGNLTLEATTLLNNQAIGGNGASGTGGAGGGSNAPASSGGVGTAGTDGGTNGGGGGGGDANGSNGGFGSGGGSGGTGGLGGGGGGDAAGSFGTAGNGGRGGHANGGAGGFGAGGGPGGTSGLGGGGGGGGGQGSGAANGETGNTDGAGFGGDGGNGSSGFGNGSGGNGGRGGDANGGGGGFGGGGGRAGQNGTAGGGGGGAPNGGGGSPGNGGANGSGGIVGGGGASNSNGSASGGSGGFGGGSGSSTTGGGGGGFGGAIFNHLGTITLINTTFYNNTAQGGSGANGGSGFGGVLFNYQGSVIATNATLSHNIVQGDTAGTDGQQSGGAVYNYQGALTFTNNILANSSGDNDCQNNGGTVTAPAENGNLIEVHSGCGSPAFTSDPNLGVLQDNGGLTQTMEPQFPSDAIDGGTDTGCPATDQPGNSRPQGLGCDIGAVETEAKADLALTKVASASEVTTGETIIYTLTFSNAGNGPAQGVSISESIPTEVNNGLSVTYTLDSGLTLTQTNGITYEWTVSDLSPGQGGVITITTQADDSLSAGTIFTNTATITTTSSESDIPNNTAEVATTVGCLAASTVTNANDSGAGSLRLAISNTCAGGIVTFDNNYTIYLNSSLSVNKQLTIDGSSHTIAVSGDSGNDGDRDVQVFNISSSGVVTLSYLNVVSGTASEGGGIYNNGSLTVNNSTFSGNNADFGGVIYNYIGKNLIVTNSTLEGNSADYGGGIFNLGILTLVNSTFSSNSATNQGGGIRNVGELTVLNSTLSGNSANEGGGIYDSLNQTHLKNILIANSSFGGDCINIRPLVTNLNNLIEDGSCSAGLSGDPLLASLGNYGGETQTFGLLPGSPAIDAGDSTTCTGSEVNNIDQRGVTRPAACDIGSFESQGFSLTISGGNNQNTPVNTAFATPLQVTVTATDTNLTVGAGQVLSFTAPASGASLSTTSFTATTNSSSTASVAVTANDIEGSYQVTATASGVSNEVSFNLTNNNQVIYLPFVVKEN